MNQHAVTMQPTGRDLFLNKISPYLLEYELEHVLTAYIFAKYGHGHKEQKRDDGSRYFDHPRAVAEILIDELGIRDWRMIVAALLHDMLEDSYLLREHRIRINFTHMVAWWVKLLTKDDKDIYHQRLIECGSWQVLMIKLCDRLHNLRTLHNCKPEKQKKQIAETKEFFFPLCDTLIRILPKKLKPKGEYLKIQIHETCARFPY